jgi:hypothetical protein
VVSTSTPELENVQPDTIQKALNTLRTRGARVSVIMMTTTPTNTASVANMTQGRQALIADADRQGQRRQISKPWFSSTAGDRSFPNGAKRSRSSHAKQIAQFRAIIDRPGGATGPLNNLGLKLTRPGAKAASAPTAASSGRSGPWP